MHKVIGFVLSLGLMNTALAENPSGLKDVPAGNPPQLPVFSGPEPRLTPKERQGITYGKEWAGNRDRPARGDEGSIVFVFGSTLPTIVCAPLYVCDLALQEGEGVNDLNVGDSVRWKITPASQGAGDAVITHVMIKPTDVGLTTNLVITTNRRLYTIKLVSRSADWMPRVSFDYPDDVSAEWRAYRARFEQRQEMTAAQIPPPRKLDFDFFISGDSVPWRPTRVYTDGVKTYILFPASVGNGDLPALVGLADDNSFLGLDSLINGASTQVLNYRFVDHRFEVDKVIDRARLVSGGGDQQATVTITRLRKD
jgi:type IV secretion system protein TrbG